MPLSALRQTKQRRAREIEMARIDHRAHLGKEECHQERGNMRPVDISVGHDDDLVVAQIINVEFGADAHAQSLTQIGDFRI